MAFPETWRFFALFSSPAAIVSTIATSIEQQSAADPRIASDVAQASEGITEVNRNVAQSNISVKAISH